MLERLRQPELTIVISPAYITDSAEAALLRRGRDRRSDLGRGRRDFAGARGRPAQEPPLPSLGHQDGARVRPDQDRRPPAR